MTIKDTLRVSSQYITICNKKTQQAKQIYPKITSAEYTVLI